MTNNQLKINRLEYMYHNRAIIVNKIFIHDNHGAKLANMQVLYL